MVYRKERGNREILHRGEYKGHQFYVVSYQTHPCCYVKTDISDSEAYEKIMCPGGITFAGHALKDFDVKGHYIGWDYAHCRDFTGWTLRGVAHTTEEMYIDVENVIDQVVKLEGGEENG